jgi:MFS transporter, Spinster family, sphingosine-1-phosphate transporter
VPVLPAPSFDPSSIPLLSFCTFSLRIIQLLYFSFFLPRKKQYVVVPTRRSTAEAFQILISHAFGDAGSPYLVGLISEALKPVLRQKENDLNFGKVIESFSQIAENATVTIKDTLVRADSTNTQFKALQYSLFSTSFVEVLGGVFFLLTAVYILKDRANVDRAVAGEKFDW